MISRVFLTVALMGASTATAQMATPGGGRPLGGYGASTIGSYYGGNGTGYAPYNGRSPGLPTGGGLAVPSVPRGPVSTPIGGASTGPARGGMGTDARSGRRMAGPGLGMGLGGPVGMPMTAPGRMRRGSPGPGLGWPFSVPAGLTGSGPMIMP